MKTKNIYLILLVVTMLIFPSCDDFLEEEPESVVAPENLFTTAQGAIAALNGAYASLNSYRIGKTGLVGNIGTDEAQIGIDERSQAASTGIDDYGNNLNPQNSILTSFWSASYYIIVRSNLVIEFTPKVANIDETLKNRIIAEARFLRAFAFFQLVQRFGGVPISTSYQVQRNNPRKTEAEVYQFIISDLEFAEQNLPNKGEYTNSDKGRATKQAAQTLLGKVLITAPQPIRNYQQAAAKLKEVIDYSVANSGTLGLEEDFSALFAPSYENGKESIFEIQFLRPDRSNDMAVRYGSRYNGMTDLRIPGAGYADARPTDYIYSLYADNDERKAATFRTEFFDINGNKITTAGNAEYLKPHVKKYEDPMATSQTIAGRNIMLLRYADVLLMYAEALLQTGGDPLPYINQVRERAEVEPFNSLDMEKLLEERSRELAFENWRWSDLKRTGNLSDFVEARHPYVSAIDANKILWPIPQDEVLTNEGISDTDQNPGY